MIRTDGRPTVAWARLPLLDRDPGDVTPEPVEERFLLDATELERRLDQARREGNAEGFAAGTRIAHELARYLHERTGVRVDL